MGRSSHIETDPMRFNFGARPEWTPPVPGESRGTLRGSVAAMGPKSINFTVSINDARGLLAVVRIVSENIKREEDDPGVVEGRW